MYFEQPDAAGHDAGPNSDAVNSALIYIDAMVNYLVQRLDQKGYLGCINLVILSDHGMQKLRKDQFMALEDYLNINDSNVEIFGGAIGNIHFKNKKSINMTSKMEKFACQKGKTFRAYTKETMPKRYHYANNRRIGDIIIDALGGTEIFKTNLALNASKMEGDHGFDNRLRSMRAIFAAYGPSIVENSTIPPFQNIELYNLFADLMRLTYKAPNNGTKGMLSPAMKQPMEYDETVFRILPDCMNMSDSSKVLTKCGDGCQFEIPLNDGGKVECLKHEPVKVPISMPNVDSLCAIRICNATMIYNKDLDQPVMSEGLLSAPVKNIDVRANCSIHFNIDFEPIENFTSISKICDVNPNLFNTTRITYFSEHEYLRFIRESQIRVDPRFYNSVWKELLLTIETYQKHYKHLQLYMGSIYDSNHDGIADTQEMISTMSKKNPTHFYVILIRCRGFWDESYRHCRNSDDTRTLAFVLPNLPEDFNCLELSEYLYKNTARIRDIELLTGLEFFTDRTFYHPEIALRLRTNVNQRLWQLEVDKEIL